MTMIPATSTTPPMPALRLNRTIRAGGLDVRCSLPHALNVALSQ